MQTDEARSLYSRRKELIEAVFGILKDQLGARRFLLRGLANVQAEFTLLATAFNLRTLCRVWNRVRKNGSIGARMAISNTNFERTRKCSEVWLHSNDASWITASDPEAMFSDQTTF